MNIVGNTKFSAHEYSFIGAQTDPFIYVLYVAAFAAAVVELSGCNCGLQSLKYLVYGLKKVCRLLS